MTSIWPRLTACRPLLARRTVRTHGSQSCRVSIASSGSVGNASHARVWGSMSVRYLSTMKPRVAVLYQAVEPPLVNGVRKPKKPGGYRDSGADIAYVLQQSGEAEVITERPHPDPSDQNGWCFPDTEEGILAAVSKGATHLWANTILFASHPLQTSSALDRHQDLRVVGQPPLLVEQYDDKNYVNSMLRRDRGFKLPKAWIVSSVDDPVVSQDKLTYPVVGKPIRGRGSHGVKVCQSKDTLCRHLEDILDESPEVMLEEFLAGQEGTVTVMPPSEIHSDYWSMPIVVRLNHDDGIAPYNGVVAVTSNSRVLSDKELGSPVYKRISEQCEKVARRLQVTAPIRIDVRQISEDPESDFAIFDVNMKPNMTGPGRPGREDQASLTALAAAELGWEYPRLLKEVLAGATELTHLRDIKLPPVD